MSDPVEKKSNVTIQTGEGGENQLELPVEQGADRMLSDGGSLEVRICPHIGKDQDPDTYHEMGSSANYCHHCKVPSSPLLDYQLIFCLKPNFANCPVYSHLDKDVFPGELVNPHSPRSKGLGSLLSHLLRLGKPRTSIR